MSLWNRLLAVYLYTVEMFVMVEWDNESIIEYQSRTKNVTHIINDIFIFGELKKYMN